MAYRVELTLRAERDFVDLHEQVNATDSVAAARWFKGLENAVLTLEKLPRRCPLAPESRRTKRRLRHLLYGRKPHVYRILYEIDETLRTVHVLTIRHGAMEAASPGEL